MSGWGWYLIRYQDKIRNSSVNNNRIGKTAHFPCISSHLSPSSLKGGERIKIQKEGKKIGPCSKNTENKGKERESLLESISFLWALKCSDIKSSVLIKKPCVYRCDIFIHTPQDFKDFRRFPWWI